MLFPKKYAEIPKGWKSKLTPGTNLLSKPKVKYEIPKISEKKKKRLKENGSEAELFKKVWNERSRTCEICKKAIREAKPECFSHILSKGRYPALRYNPKNITLVCSMECHAENDKRNKGKDLQLINIILGKPTKSE